MGSAPPSSAPSGSGTVTAKEVAGAGDGNGSPSVSGTASGMAISGPTGNSGPAATRGAEGAPPPPPPPPAAPPPPPRREDSPSLSRPAAGLGVLRDQRGRKVHLGGGTAARGQPQRHLDAVSRR